MYLLGEWDQAIERGNRVRENSGRRRAAAVRPFAPDLATVATIHGLRGEDAEHRDWAALAEDVAGTSQQFPQGCGYWSKRSRSTSARSNGPSADRRSRVACSGGRSRCSARRTRSSAIAGGLLMRSSAPRPAGDPFSTAVALRGRAVITGSDAPLREAVSRSSSGSNALTSLRGPGGLSAGLSPGTPPGRHSSGSVRLSRARASRSAQDRAGHPEDAVRRGDARAAETGVGNRHHSHPRPRGADAVLRVLDRYAMRRRNAQPSGCLRVDIRRPPPPMRPTPRRGGRARSVRGRGRSPRGSTMSREPERPPAPMPLPLPRSHPGGEALCLVTSPARTHTLRDRLGVIWTQSCSARYRDHSGELMPSMSRIAPSSLQLPPRSVTSSRRARPRRLRSRAGPRRGRR